jgi:hypothetical protein
MHTADIAARWKIRLASASLAVVCAAVLVLANRLTPDPRGLGTHEGLGLPPCGFLMATGIPCPTCGMTSAYSLMSHGRVLMGLRAQPAGAMLCLLTAAGVLAGLWIAVTGRAVRVRWDWFATWRGPALLAGVFFGAWGWKIVDYLMTR